MNVRAFCVSVSSLLAFSACQVVTGLDGLQVVDAGEGTASAAVSGMDASAPRGRDARDASPPEAREPGGACKSSKDCPPGQTCEARTCRKAPPALCPTAEDGTCDEAQNGGDCADGTDAKDCNCAPQLADAHCDPIAQCGCPKDQACAVTRESMRVSAACMAWTGTIQDEGACKVDRDCAAGYVCRPGGTCARLCNDDSACTRGACLPIVWDSASEGLKVCYVACDRREPVCPSGTRCAQFDDRFPFQGDYCVAPVAKCAAPDGVCDEERGSGLCANGTDVVDCCQSSLPGGECDLVKQCGCEKKPGMRCTEAALGTVERTSVCAPPGAVAANNWCLDDSSCAAGLGCSGHVCRPYCAADADCGEGASCIAAVRDGGATSVKVCLGPCTPETNAPCGPATRCKMGVIDDRPVTGCSFVPFTDECPKEDGRCDEPQGTGICAVGSDAADCT